MKKVAVVIILVLTLIPMQPQAQKTKYLSMSPNLMVKDIQASQDFYTKILGFKILDQEPKDTTPVWLMLGYNDITFMLQSTASLGDEIPSLKNKETGGTLIFYFTITDIKSLYDKVKNDVTIISDFKKTFYNALEFTIADPDGYLLTFAEFPEEIKD